MEKGGLERLSGNDDFEKNFDDLIMTEEFKGSSITEEKKDDVVEYDRTEQVGGSVVYREFGDSERVAPEGTAIEEIRRALVLDGSSEKKALGKNFKNLAEDIMSKRMDDPAALNESVDLLSREAIRNMFDRTIGRQS